MKIVISIIVLIIVIVLTSLFLLWQAVQDIPAPDTSDLELPQKTVLPEDNAFSYYLSATNTLYKPEDDIILNYLHSESVNENILADIFTQNTQTFALILQGNEYQRCIVPAITNFDVVHPFVSDWFKMGRLLAAKARYERTAGQYSEATDTCICLLRFSTLVQRDATTTIHYLVGLTTLAYGLVQAEDLICDTNTPTADLKRLSKALSELAPLEPGLIYVLKGEYQFADRIIDNLASGKFSYDDMADSIDPAPPAFLKGKRIPQFGFQPNKTKALFAEHYRDIITQIPLPYTEMDLNFEEKLPNLEEQRWRHYMRPNIIGKVLCRTIMPALGKILEKKCIIECNISAVHLLAAIQAFHRDSGTFPKSLQVLMPDYIDAIPTDPFDGKPFRYNAEKGFIYSVGKDGVDSGGSTNMPAGCEPKDRWEQEDIVFSLAE